MIAPKGPQVALDKARHIFNVSLESLTHGWFEGDFEILSRVSKFQDPIEGLSFTMPSGDLSWISTLDLKPTCWHLTTRKVLLPLKPKAMRLQMAAGWIDIWWWLGRDGTPLRNPPSFKRCFLGEDLLGHAGLLLNIDIFTYVIGRQVNIHLTQCELPMGFTVILFLTVEQLWSTPGNQPFWWRGLCLSAQFFSSILHIRFP